MSGNELKKFRSKRKFQERKKHDETIKRRGNNPNWKC